MYIESTCALTWTQCTARPSTHATPSLVSIAPTVSRSISTHSVPGSGDRGVTVDVPSSPVSTNCGATSNASRCGDAEKFFVTARPSNLAATSSPATDARTSLASSQTARYRRIRRRRRAFCPGDGGEATVDVLSSVSRSNPSEDRLRYSLDATPTRCDARGHFSVDSVAIALFSVSPGTARTYSRVERMTHRRRTLLGRSVPANDDASASPSPCAERSLLRRNSRAAPSPPASRAAASPDSSRGHPSARSLDASVAASNGASCDASETSNDVAASIVRGVSDATRRFARTNLVRVLLDASPSSPLQSPPPSPPPPPPGTSRSSASSFPWSARTARLASSPDANETNANPNVSPSRLNARFLTTTRVGRNDARSNAARTRAPSTPCGRLPIHTSTSRG
eukprot:5016-Pelagococcus_subviridis.AAC.2